MRVLRGLRKVGITQTKKVLRIPMRVNTNMPSPTTKNNNFATEGTSRAIEIMKSDLNTISINTHSFLTLLVIFTK